MARGERSLPEAAAKAQPGLSELKETLFESNKLVSLCYLNRAHSGVSFANMSFHISGFYCDCALSLARSLKPRSNSDG